MGLYEQFFVDPLNVFLVALTAFVGFTTSLFSRPYMRIERDKGRMTPARLRLYHSMYQVFKREDAGTRANQLAVFKTRAIRCLDLSKIDPAAIDRSRSPAWNSE